MLPQATARKDWVASMFSLGSKRTQFATVDTLTVDFGHSRPPTLDQLTRSMK